ncbi:uncharacterized protein FIBRA_01377 [Fibroporia radiculosa]|uniref:Uncharacterized protein n=1 Tax=Fibroporia radiculosa TaxID=599839 RepID=J4H131_9APHY|nr:uncharacterized protein FIBRA_01377 [Fibroporia radiculosa]CCL99359.1 predicted protein [Fibroporia radiculosa]
MADPIIDIVNIIVGPIFIGMLFFFLIYGGTIGQTIYYLRNYSQDRLSIKFLVAGLFLLDTAKAFGDGEMFWFYLIQNHGDVIGLSAITVWVGVQNILGVCFVPFWFSA